jgi:hypothetical protein
MEKSFHNDNKSNIIDAKAFFWMLSDGNICSYSSGTFSIIIIDSRNRCGFRNTHLNDSVVQKFGMIFYVAFKKTPYLNFPAYLAEAIITSKIFLSPDKGQYQSFQRGIGDDIYLFYHLYQ